MVTVAKPELKIKATTAQEICAQFALSERGRPHLQPDMPPLAFVDSLVASGFYDDALQFLARALPKREAVWWSCLCAREVLSGNAAPELTAGLHAAEAWVYRPNEDNRRKAEAAGKSIAASHPARWAAMAAFWSGGSIAPMDASEVKPADDFTSKAVAGAVMMAAALDPLQSEMRHRQFVDSGIDIAKGGTGRPLARS
jgi:hypothetical protein